MGRKGRDKQGLCFSWPLSPDQGRDKQEGHRGWAGMRKSAVRVRSEDGIPAHMTRERTLLGEERRERCGWGRKEGTYQAQRQCYPPILIIPTGKSLVPKVKRVRELHV